ncbi:TRAP transporter small permease [Mesorhizobium sp. L-8-3]|uniref:TRAP transporter small permease n=1 Tax=Mesorhizobium sp. L-8-3 TaxID=2744522 RepID=UPI001926E858|nr:TRAP transporter small permease subunit [Mesorhizobium sp. L-8-3]BCH20788.1 C4-dicarboxylate ABC transporter permease [Mesorhizobium sp. L-8-3]
MQRLASLKTWLGRRAEEVLALMMASLFVTFLIQIVFRYFLNLPLGWTIEYVSITWLWGILFGYAYVTRDCEIIRFDIVYSAVPTSVQRAMDVFTGLTCAAIFLWSLPAVWDYVTFMAVERTAFLRIRFDHLFAIYLPFAISVAVRCLINAWQAIAGTHPRYNSGATAEAHDHD